MKVPEIIVAHTNTDFDALAAMLAAAKLYPAARLCLSGALNRNVREFCGLYAEQIPAIDASLVEPDAVRRLIAIETLEPNRLGELGRLLEREDVAVVSFDHHAAVEPRLVRHRPIDRITSEDGALTTLMLRILAERSLPITPLEATVFALGIHEDTGSLTFSTATPRDAEALAYCMRQGASPSLIERFLHSSLTAAQRALLSRALEEAEPVEAAASAVLRDGDLEAARAAVIAGVRAAGERSRTARDVMTGPARWVDHDTTVDEALRLCRRFGITGVAVARDARLVGTVSEADLRRAVGHELGHAPVKAVMTSGVAALEEATPVAQVAAVLAASPIGAVPVVRVGAPTQQPLVEDVTGVVRRSDVIGGWGPAPAAAATAAPNLASRLDELGLADLLEHIQAIGTSYAGVYLVGGAVRDLLLHERTIDIDVAVEGDGIAFAPIPSSAPRWWWRPKQTGERGCASTSPPRAASSTRRQRRCRWSSTRPCAATWRGATSP
jgi:predicted transcriptional regulator